MRISDWSSDVCSSDLLPVLTGLGLCILAARAQGVAIVDGVHLDLDDAEGFAAQCRQGKELGFDGKTLIHPKTIAKANAVFAPSAEERSEEHTSELQSLMRTSYAVFCLKTKKIQYIMRTSIAAVYQTTRNITSPNIEKIQYR